MRLIQALVLALLNASTVAHDEDRFQKTIETRRGKHEIHRSRMMGVTDEETKLVEIERGHAGDDPPERNVFARPSAPVSAAPSSLPLTGSPSATPSGSLTPSSAAPVATSPPTVVPSLTLTIIPSAAPVAAAPSAGPSLVPSTTPSAAPLDTGVPSLLPSVGPSLGESSAAPSGTATSSIGGVLLFHPEPFATLLAMINALDPAASTALLQGTDPPVPFTLFAPTDLAFQALGANDQSYFTELYQNPIWENHLNCFISYQTLFNTTLLTSSFVNDQAVSTVNGAEVVLGTTPPSVNFIPIADPDQLATNGVVHVISQEPVQLPCTSESIWEQGVASRELLTLFGLLQAAGLELILENNRPLTLFAPTEAAFQSLPIDTLLFLIDPANAAELESVMRYHILLELAFLGNETVTTPYNTINGNPITVTPIPASDGGGALTFTVQGGTDGNIANVIPAGTNILAKNGVIQLIDQVLLPPGFSTGVPTAPVTGAPVVTTAAPGTVAPGTIAPIAGTMAPGTVAPIVGTMAPGTVAPGTIAPIAGTIAPGTIAPIAGTMAPGTVAPGISVAPVTIAPIVGTMAPGTVAPGTIAPIAGTVAPGTVAPGISVAPVTIAPIAGTMAPGTVAPGISVAPVTIAPNGQTTAPTTVAPAGIGSIAPNTPSPIAGSLAPNTIAPVGDTTTAPVTLAPAAPNTIAPVGDVTGAPTTLAPASVTAPSASSSPSTTRGIAPIAPPVAPNTIAPVGDTTAAPGTPAPVIVTPTAPNTIAPVGDTTAAPGTPAPVTPAPVIVTPTAPNTIAPVGDTTIAPATAAPVGGTTAGPTDPIAPTAGGNRDDVFAFVRSILTDDSALTTPGTVQNFAVETLLITNPDLDPADPADQVIISQTYALNTLFFATNFTGWTNADGWFLGPFCSEEGNWFGVTCAEGDLTRVTEVVLNQNGLSGFIPSEIRGLASLERLELANSETGTSFLTGEIPSTIGEMVNLQVINLSTNSLGFVFPPEEGAQPVPVTNAIPTELVNLRSLRSFKVENNFIFQPLSFDLFIPLPVLDELNLAINILTGTVPTQIGNLPASLTTLNLDSNRYVGTIPTELGNLVNLRSLRISRSDSSPEPAGICPASEDDPSQESCLGGPIPSEIGNLVNLQELWLFANSLDSAIPSEIGNCAALSTLVLFANELSSLVPSEIGGLASLETLDLATNFLGPTLTSEIFNLPPLINLNLGFNVFNVTKLPETFNLPNLQVLRLDRNGLTGTLPIALTTLSNLQILDLGSNFFTGVIPTEFGSFQQMQHLVLEINTLTGTVPTELGNIGVSMQQLEIAANGFTGTIPTELGLLANLQDLELTNNGLVGTIPTELGGLVALLELELDLNTLTGTIPTELGQLVALTRIRVEFTTLTGAMPDEVCALAPPPGNLTEIVSDCGGDAPELTCACCTACQPAPTR